MSQLRNDGREWQVEAYHDADGVFELVSPPTRGRGLALADESGREAVPVGVVFEHAHDPDGGCAFKVLDLSPTLPGQVPPERSEHPMYAKMREAQAVMLQAAESVAGHPNVFLVGVQGGNVVVGNPPLLPIRPRFALLLAAYLAVLADPSGEEFSRVYEAVKF